MKFIKSLYTRFHSLGHYALIAAVGLLLDTAIFLILTHGGLLSVFWASMIGMLCGASFSYIFATRRIFTGRAGFSWSKWAIFIAYIIGTMFIWSGIIAALVAFGLWPLLAKFATLPISFYANFLFMGWLQEGRIRWH